ncbi:hypothetical protein NAT51_13030 [Flavobacterium amniphilum]|uniref:hypothetical protein n=1 Tax=Flavobacterium amniphilum TaxID=1834035 RepID=UPI00202A2E3B|nr:hypothetical protein [Flavobacterium amniphilum]MCL9806454.1 hypothetical protein [Flavobacterium amniphilum]
MKQILVILSAFLLLNSCSNDSDGAIGDKQRTVYVVGQGRIEPESNYRAMLWRNGEPQFLSPADCYGHASRIAVDNEDVHVVGFLQYNGGVKKATYWKNGTVQTLEIDDSSDSLAMSICIYDNDVYISGYNNGHSCYWKNGVFA